jgi:hypothetical protein
MTSHQVVAFLALLLAVQASVSPPGSNDTISSAGFGSNLISGFNRLVSKITGSGNNTAAGATTGSSNNTATGVTGSGNNTTTNITVVCPPPKPHLEVT